MTEENTQALVDQAASISGVTTLKQMPQVLSEDPGCIPKRFVEPINPAPDLGSGTQLGTSVPLDQFSEGESALSDEDGPTLIELFEQETGPTPPPIPPKPETCPISVRERLSRPEYRRGARTAVLGGIGCRTTRFTPTQQEALMEHIDRACDELLDYPHLLGHVYKKLTALSDGVWSERKVTDIMASMLVLSGLSSFLTEDFNG